MNLEVRQRILRHIIDTSGDLSNDVINKVAHSVIRDEHFSGYDPLKNEFTDNPCAQLYAFARNYFMKYKVPATAEIIRTEISIDTELTPSEQRAILLNLNTICQYNLVPNEIDFICEQLINEYKSNYQTSIFLKSTILAGSNIDKSIDFTLSALNNLKTSLNVSKNPDQKPMFLGQLINWQLGILNDKGTLRPNPIRYGIRDMDEILGGMYPGDVIVFSGKPGGFKSAFTHQIAYFNSLDLQKVGVICDNELSYQQNVVRLLANRTGIPSRRLTRTNALKDSDKEILNAFQEHCTEILSENCLFLPPDQCLTVESIKRNIDVNLGDKQPSYILVDYLDVMRPSKGYVSSDHEAVKLVLGELKQLALHYGCPVMTISQPNRKGNTTDDAGMGDLAHVAVSRAADGIIFLSVDSTHPPQSNRNSDEVGEPGILFAKVIKYRSEDINIPPFRLYVEGSTSRIEQAPPFEAQPRTELGRSWRDRRADE